MEGGKYDNPDNSYVVAAEGNTNPSNESLTKSPSTKASGDAKPPYTPLYVWLK